ncbi:MAG: ATP-binding protein [Burkholderiales bacterium]
MPRIGLRSKLLLATAALAALPLVGVAYVREFEALLRTQQEEALLAAARAIATTLHDRPAVLRLRPEPPKPPAPTPTPAPAAPSAEAPPALVPSQDGDEAQRATAAQPAALPALPLAPPPAAAQESVGDEVTRIVGGLNRSASRVWVVDRKRRLLALAGSLTLPRSGVDAAPPSAWERVESTLLRPLYARLLTRPGTDFDDSLAESVISGAIEVERALTGIATVGKRLSVDERAEIVSAAHPVFAGNDVIGAVVVEETTNAIASFATRALEKLITATLAATLVTAIVLLLVASSITRRVVRLSDDALAALDTERRRIAPERLRAIERAGRSGDEIGDLSRSFATLLGRIAQQHDYLEKLGTRLAHELRTPIAVVRSSLDNLREGSLNAAAMVYLKRAEEGVSRLSAMLSRMSEARRVEEAVGASPREAYDARQVVAGCVEGYRDAAPGRHFDLRLPEAPLRVSGSPDLLAQALDKLVSNALDFARAGSPISVALDRAGTSAVVSVTNQGPPLAEAVRDSLFDSMVSARDADGTAEPHLGLGLFIVRLVAEFHGGHAAAVELPDGVRFEMRLPEAAAA